jgi:hypothetical protein
MSSTGAVSVGSCDANANCASRHSASVALSIDSSSCQSPCR